MKLKALVLTLVTVAGLLTTFGQGRAPQSETKRLHDLAVTGPLSEGLGPAKKPQLASAYGRQQAADRCELPQAAAKRQHYLSGSTGLDVTV